MVKYIPRTIRNFFLLGTLGCLIEILFTSLTSLRRRRFQLIGTTSLWMFPIYGLGCLIGPFYTFLRSLSWPKRGLIYTFFIYITEFFSGLFLNKHHCCPWNYEHSKWNIASVIRLDYFPCWFLTGLLFERIIRLSQKTNSPN